MTTSKSIESEIPSDLDATNYMARTSKRWKESNIPVDTAYAAHVDAVHSKVLDTEDYITPGQLYSTESGSLFHAGRILIVLVGLPATSKTLLSVAITRYTRWLGVRTESFHLSEYRREHASMMSTFLSDEFSTIEGNKCKDELFEKISDDMIRFFENSKGQIAIYDALNIRKQDRAGLHSKFLKIGVKVLFVESIVTDIELLKRNIELAIQSVDYKDWEKQKAINDYTKRITSNASLYESMSPGEHVPFIQYFNFGKRIIVNNTNYGYLVNKIVFFLMNLRNKEGSVYFSRCGTSNSDMYIDDEVLNEEGLKFSNKLTKVVLDRIKYKRGLRKQNTGKSSNKNEEISKNKISEDDFDVNSLVVWTAPRKRTYDTGLFFEKMGIDVRQRSSLKQLHPGVIADLSVEEIKSKYPKEYNESLKDPYHYRFTRAESYHDLAVRMEPLLLEMEHMHKDILIIAHESTLRVLFGYFMACTSLEVPTLEFTRDQLVEISFSPFCNKVERIPIDL